MWKNANLIFVFKKYVPYLNLFYKPMKICRQNTKNRRWTSKTADSRSGGDGSVGLASVLITGILPIQVQRKEYCAFDKRRDFSSAYVHGIS